MIINWQLGATTFQEDSYGLGWVMNTLSAQDVVVIVSGPYYTLSHEIFVAGAFDVDTFVAGPSESEVFLAGAQEFEVT